VPRHTNHPSKTRSDRRELEAARRATQRASRAIEEAEALDGRDFETGAPLPGASSLTNPKSEGLRSFLDSHPVAPGPAPNGDPNAGKRRQAERLYAMSEDRRRRAKHAPSVIDRERALRRADAWEAQADAIWRELPEAQPAVAGEEYLSGPACRCGAVFPDRAARWDHILRGTCNPT